MAKFPELGVGMLIHNSKRYTDYLKLVGDHVDVYELIMGQYEEEPSTINMLRETLKKPMLMHNSFFTFATDVATDQAVLHKINDRLERAEAVIASDHICFTGVPGTAVGALIPPILDERQLDVLIRRIKEAQEIVTVPLALENVVLHYQIGDMKYAEFITRLANECDIGILVSLENITQSKHYVGFDHCEFIDSLPADKIVQVHCTIGNSSEQKAMKHKHYGTVYDKQLMHYEVLEHMAKKGIKPATLIWELETETPSLPDSVEFIERMEWARGIFSYQKGGVRV